MRLKQKDCADSSASTRNTPAIWSSENWSRSASFLPRWARPETDSDGSAHKCTDPCQIRRGLARINLQVIVNRQDTNQCVLLPPLGGAAAEAAVRLQAKSLRSEDASIQLRWSAGILKLGPSEEVGSQRICKVRFQTLHL